MKMIDTLKNLGQTDSEATVEVGVTIGVVTSLLIFATASACLVRTRKPTPSATDVSEEDSQNADAVQEGASEADLEHGTEGAYRSDSDSEDDVQNRKIAIQAQKRARNTSGI